MKKIFFITLLFTFCLMLASCLELATTFPDMIEYQEEEILNVAKEKYNIKEFYYTSLEVRKSYLQKEQFTYDNYKCYGIFNNIKNPDNLEKALTAFAGKNGGHDIQGMYRFFACYVALGVDNNNTAKFIYYNTNISKHENIIDTIGSSDYPFDLHPSKIDTKFMDKITWDNLRINLKNIYHDEISIKGLYYCFDKPTIIKYLGNNSHLYLIEFYEESEKNVFDVYSISVDDYYDLNDIYGHITSKELLYSTSKNYDFYFHQYGTNPEDFFDINFTVEQSKEASYLDLISGTITVKDVGKEVINYGFNFKITYKVGTSGNLISKSSSYGASELINNRFGLLIDKIDGHDHNETTTVTVFNFYIIYKNN